MPDSLLEEQNSIHCLLLLTLDPEHAEPAVNAAKRLDAEGLSRFRKLAHSHHVPVRAFQVLASVAGLSLRAWAEDVLQNEQSRISRALAHLDSVCKVLEKTGCPVVVIKSLDHWPDLGNDLDLFTTAPGEAVAKVLGNKLGAKIQARSWGDRLAQKWNFEIPGLPESVEVHCQRIGQTGEQVAVAKRFITRRVPKNLGTHTFMTPAPEERIIVASLQRLYRHFYFRICDIVNMAALIDSGTVDYAELRRASLMGGIWHGVATYLQVVRDYVAQYQRRELHLPQTVLDAARFGKERLVAQRGFIRMPIMPDGASLYRAELAAAAKRRDVPAAFRLSLLPPLASAAALAYKLTGSDKGVW